MKSNILLQRHSRSDIALHWLNALCWLMLLLTGIALIDHPALSPFGGAYPAWVRRVVGGGGALLGLHVATGIVWVGIFALYLITNAKAATFFLRQVFTVQPGDGIWLVRKMCHMGLGRKLSSSLGVSHELPPQGYYNAGQKAFAVVSVLLGLGIVASGVLLAASTSLNAQQFPVLVMLVPWAIALHHFSVGGVLAGLLVHIYMAAISPDERPGLVSMFTGTVPLDYAQHHHPLWDTPELNRCRIAPRHTHRNPTAEKE